MKANKDVELYFTSKAASLIFAALHTDGATRCKLLGMVDKCYHDRDAAELWRIETINEINLGTDFDKETRQLAIDAVNKMYKGWWK